MSELERLRMLLEIALFALDMSPGAELSKEPWVRLAESAHMHGRKLEREEIVADLRKLWDLDKREGVRDALDFAANRYERREHKKENAL